MKTRKIVASALALAMTGSVFAGCSSSSSKKNTTLPRTISADTPWYECTELEMGSQYNNAGYDNVWSNMVGQTGEGFLIATNASYEIPDSAWDDPNFDSSEYNKLFYDYYDINGELISSFDIYSVDKPDVDGDFYINVADVVGDYVLITGEAWSNDYSVCTNYNLRYDYATGTAGEWEDPINTGVAADSDDWETWANKFPDASFEGKVEAGDYSVYKYWQSEGRGNSTYTIIVVDPDGNETTIDMFTVAPNKDLWNIDNVIKIADDKLLVIASENFFTIDTNSMAMEDVTEDYSWLEGVDLWNSYTDADGNLYTMNYSAGIKKIDFENSTVESILTSENTFVNPSKLGNMEIISIDGDNIVLAGSIYTSSLLGDNEQFLVLKFTKADSNPNAGKTIIRVASIDSYITDAMYESLVQFNTNSDTHYMMIDGRYDISEGVDYNNIETYEDYMSIIRENTTRIADQLSVDLISGEGPDIIFNAYSLSQLNNTDYLIDLSDIASDDSLFSNVMDACKVDGKLYQVPIVINTVGISTYAEYVNDGQVGFTYDEYLQFVDEVCNGDDPIQLDRGEYFNVLYSAMADVFRSGNTLNLNNDEFTALAEYVKNNVNEHISYDDEGVWIDGPFGNYEPPKASYGALSSISSFFSTYGDRVADVRLLGIPTYDARGPQFTYGVSVAVSAQSASADICKDYVSSLLSEDMQYTFSDQGWSTPVNRDVLRTAGELAVEQHNNDVDMFSQWYTEEELIAYGLSTTKLDDTAIDYYIGIIEGCTSCSIDDVAISSIMGEEMQAYYAGQKDLATVVDTMSNRISTYLRERG